MEGTSEPTAFIYTIKAGTLIHINGMPLTVIADTPAHVHPANVPLIEEKFTAHAGDGLGETAAR